MRILFKIPLALAGLFVLYFGAMIIVDKVYIQSRFKELEMAAASRDLARVMSAIDSESEHLATFVADWSNWDDTYAFVAGENSDYIETNLGLEAWKATKADIIAVYGLDRKKRYSGRLDTASDAIVPDDTFPSEAPLDAPYIQSGRADESYIQGFMDSPRGYYLIASTPILRSDTSGPVRGSFIMGRRIDRSFDAALSGRTSVAAELHPPAATGIDFARLLSKERFLETSVDAIRGYALLRDLWGSPALVISTKTEREISAWGRETIRVSRYLIVGLGIAFCFVMVVLMSKLVIRPLSIIRAHIKYFEIEGGARLPPSLIARADEIGDLSAAFQQMSESLAVQDRELRDANDKLESKVEERTRELARASDDLRLMAKVVENTSEAVVITDLDAKMLVVNEAFCAGSGYSRDELLGKNPRILKSERHDEVFYRQLWEHLLAEDTWTGEIWDRKKSGEVYPKWLTINVVRQEDGLPRWFVGLSSDISRIKETEERLNKLAYYDPLTALPNRALFLDRLEHAMLRSRRYASRIALLVLDLDRFKIVNDAMGHPMGDRLLVEVSRRLSGTVRDSDTVCRLGGDEFTIILDQVGRGEFAGSVARNIIEELGKPFLLHDREVFIGASIGIALFPDDDETAEGLMRKADAAMYQAKSGGRDTFRFVSSETEATSMTRLTLESELRRAVEHRDFEVHYQPIVGLADGLIHGAEALVRWRRNGELVAPGSFIGLAEETGIILKLGDWILAEACAAAMRWSRNGMPLAISVNFSPRQFEHVGLARKIEACLAATGLPPDLLVVEITETAVMADVEMAQRTMNEFREIGMKIAIDDFGTGYSSLSYLSRFPVDKLKIDQSFVRGIKSEATMATIVDAVIAMSRSLGISTLAEGIETETQLSYLQKRGCDEGQGYLFGKPVEEDRFIATVASLSRSTRI